MTANTCRTCQHWKPIDDYPNGGNCRKTQGFTTAGNWCQGWEAQGARARSTIPRGDADDGSLTASLKEFDIAKAADRVIAYGGPVNIVNAQKILRCQYRQAAAVIELLKTQGRIV